MSKTFTGVLIVAVVLVGGYFAFHKSNITDVNQAANNIAKETAPTVPTTSTAKKVAFSEFVKKGGSYKCTVKQSTSNIENNGTIYINGANTRGEFSTVAAGKNIGTVFIVKDGYSYMWSASMPMTGFKIKAASDASGNPGTAASGTYSWNASQIGDYNCQPWTVDQSKFSLPSNVTFKDMSQLKAQ